MKRLITTVLVIALICTSVMYVPKRVEAKSFVHYYDAQFDGISIDWTKVKTAKKYRVYRVKVKYSHYCKEKKSSFKKIATTKKRNFFDKKVKYKTYYRYYVEALNGKGKVVGNSYKKWESPAIRLYLGSVDIRLDRRSKKKIVFKVDPEIQMGPNAYTTACENKVRYSVYRRMAGTKKFKIIKAKFNGDSLKDNRVKAGKRYYYKVKSYLIYKKKKYVGKMTKPIEAAAVNYRPKYNFSSITPTQVLKNRKNAQVVVKVSNASKYNGNTVFFKKKCNDFNDSYISINNQDDRDDWFAWNKYTTVITEYSNNGIDWKPVKEKGVKLPKKKALYLRIDISFVDMYFASSDKTIHYAAQDDTYYKSYFNFTYSLQYEKEFINNRWNFVKNNKKYSKSN